MFLVLNDAPINSVLFKKQQQMDRIILRLDSAQNFGKMMSVLRVAWKKPDSK